MKAKLGNKEDREYYQQYCKDGVDFAKLVSCSDDLISHFLYLCGLKCTKGVLFFFLCDSEPSGAPEGQLVSSHADAQ